MVASQRALDMFAMLFAFFFKIQGGFSGCFFPPLLLYFCPSNFLSGPAKAIYSPFVFFFNLPSSGALAMEQVFQLLPL